MCQVTPDFHSTDVVAFSFATAVHKTTTRALHIEVAQSLDTESCLVVVTRVIARQSRPNITMSDNGTNFVGAAGELKAFMDAWEKAKIESNLAQKKDRLKIQHTWIATLWWNLAETSSKLQECLDCNLEKQCLNEKVLSTTMCLVEQTLNARPLTAVSNDPNDLTALTPNHLLLGRESGCAPFLPSAEHYHDFKTAQSYANKIWKRWTREQLLQLNQRSEW